MHLLLRINRIEELIQTAGAIAPAVFFGVPGMRINYWVIIPNMLSPSAY
jgi:hypothetical protein